jgi:ribonuclease HIII
MFSGAWIGTDTAGEAEYFGPLVATAVMVFDATVPRLVALGLCDSDFSTFAEVLRLGVQVRSAFGFRTVEIGPKRYNELIQQGAHPFRLSAWAQSQATESLLRVGAATDNVLIKHPDVPYVAARLRQRFPHRTFTVETGTETDIAIAAARLIAREHYFNWLSKASFNLKVRLPAGPADDPAVREIGARFGKAKLSELAKATVRGGGSDPRSPAALD